MSDIGLKGIMDPSLSSAISQKKLPKLEGLQDKKLAKASKEFETMFLDMVFKSMRETTAFESDAMGDSKASKMYQELLDQEYAKNSAGRFGIAQALYNQMTRINGEAK